MISFVCLVIQILAAEEEEDKNYEEESDLPPKKKPAAAAAAAKAPPKNPPPSAPEDDLSLSESVQKMSIATPPYLLDVKDGYKKDIMHEGRRLH